jgi:homoserine kinase type II
MAAYTPLSTEALKHYLEGFDIGSLTQFEAISTGIENSNYRITTQHFEQEVSTILTLVEGDNQARLPFVKQVMQHLSHYGLPVPIAKKTRSGQEQPMLLERPTLLMQRLPGTHYHQTTADHCFQLGQMMARMHTISTALPVDSAVLYDSLWMTETLTSVAHLIPDSQVDLIASAIELYATLEVYELPRGLIHGDLFKDNILFQENKISGLLDFFHVSQDLWILDLGIAINDWCSNEQGVENQAASLALLSGYREIRPLEQAEEQALPAARKIAAARFALTRLQTYDAGQFLKDPQEQLRKLAIFGL